VTNATSATSQIREILQICSWCLPHKIRILGEPLTLEPGARLSFEVDGHGMPTNAWMFTGGEFHSFKLSHGICPECARKLRPEPRRIQ
jgi:hypothetical protein